MVEASLHRVTDSDPGYKLLNWIMAKLKWEIYGVNTVCGIIFILGLLSYCWRLPAPWLGLVVAVPYLVIVVAMGYTRQSVALGFFFLALADIERGYFLRYLVWVALGATFHKSAVLLVPMDILNQSATRLVLAQRDCHRGGLRPLGPFSGGTSGGPLA